MRKLKLYIETSTWNFFFADDAPEKRDVTREFFNLIRENRYEGYISELVLREINVAPEAKRSQLGGLIKSCPLIELEITEAAQELAERYISTWQT